MKKDNTGRYFIDRDGKYFNHILNYLRDGTTPPFSPKYKPEKYHCLASEAQFYQIQGLIDKLQQKYPKWKMTGKIQDIIIGYFYISGELTTYQIVDPIHKNYVF